MSKTNKFLLLALVIVFIFLGIYAGKESGQFSKIKPTNSIDLSENNLNFQENEGGNVTITVKPKVLKVSKKPVFELEFETHSVDLDFDVAKQSSLIDDQGKTIGYAIWDGSPPGGHHRSGTLSFNNFLTGTTNAELIIRNVAGVPERKFKWDL